MTSGIVGGQWPLVSAALAGGAGYLLGSISFAIVASRAFGLADPRTFGSHNPGATNVLRTGNKAAALITLLGDAFKGTVAVLLARWAAQQAGVAPDGVTMVAAAAGFGAFVGHLAPLYHGFAGGKGVATFLGVVLALDPRLALGVGASWLVVALLSRYSSLASLVSAGVAPALFLATGRGFVVSGLLAAMAALLAWRHRDNIAKLRQGTERKIGEKKPSGSS